MTPGVQVLGTGFSSHYGRYGVQVSHALCLSWQNCGTNKRHKHREEYEFNLVLGGSGEYYHRDQVHPLRRGDIFVSEPFVPHEINSMRTRDLNVLWLNVYIHTVDTEVASVYEDRLMAEFIKGHQYYLPGQTFLLDYLPLLSRTASARSSRKLSSQHLVQSLFFDFIELFNLNKLDLGNPDMNMEMKPFTILNMASNYIMGHLAHNLSVAEIAHAVFTSERNLRHLFRKHMDTTVVDYVNSKKMEYAGYLLSLQLQVQEVGAAVGIESSAQFSRLFKKHQGVSPREYKTVYPSVKHDLYH